jgi:hypothetical protein
MKKHLLILLTSFYSAFAIAQTPCDSLEIKVRYAAFTDTLIEISVMNHGTAYYSYPGFIVFNTNGDTVAKESVNLFGIGPASESRHTLKIYPGMVTTSSFSGTLQLWSGFYSNLECSYNLSFELCPDTCQVVYPFIANFGGAISQGTVNWTMLNATSTVVASGSWTLDNQNQDDKDTVCLIPGNYTLQVSGSPGPLGGQPWYGMTSDFNSSPNPQKPYLASADQMTFKTFKNCIITSVNNPHISSDIKLISQDGFIDISRANNKVIGEVAVYSINGQLSWSADIKSSAYRIDLRYLPSGIYIVKMKNGIVSRKIFIGN